MTSATIPGLADAPTTHAALLDWVREVAPVVGGGGGGKPDMAQAGGKDPAKIPAAIETAVSRVMDLTPRGIRTHLGLNKPIYQRTAAYGHFGRKPDADGGFSWEKTDLVEALKKAV